MRQRRSAPERRQTSRKERKRQRRLPGCWEGADGGGVVGVKFGALQERNGEGAIRHHVGHGGAGDRAEQRRGQDGDLGGTTAPASGDGSAEVHEECASAGALQKGAKNHERKDKGSEGGRSDAEQCFLRRVDRKNVRVGKRG